MHELELKEQKTLEEKLDDLEKDFSVSSYITKKGKRVKAHARKGGIMIKKAIFLKDHPLEDKKEPKKESRLRKPIEKHYKKKYEDPQKAKAYRIKQLQKKARKVGRKR